MILIFKCAKEIPSVYYRWYIVTKIYKTIFGKYIMKEYNQSTAIESKVEISKEFYEKIKTEYLNSKN